MLNVFNCFSKFRYLNFGFTPTRPVGRAPRPPPPRISQSFRRAKFSDHTACSLFPFKSPATFKTVFAKFGLTVTMLPDIFHTHVSLKTAQKCDFCIQSQGIIPPKIRFQSPLLCDLEQKICLHA